MKNKSNFSNLKESERRDRMDIILDAAERVFSTTPFGDVSMRRIAKEAGCSPASIYRYFADQEALFMETYLRRTKDILKTFDVIINESDETVISKLAFHYIDYHIRHDVYFRMMIHFMLYYNLNPASLEKLNSIMRAAIGTFEAAIVRSKITGNTRLLAHLLFASLNGILITFHNYPGRSAEEVLKHMNRLASILCSLKDSNFGDQIVSVGMTKSGNRLAKRT